jgi:hypothetical protein
VAFFFSGLAKQARTDLRVMSPTSVARCGKRGERRRGRTTWGPRKACFVGRGKAKAQVKFSACGKCNIVACALTKRVAAGGEGRSRSIGNRTQARVCLLQPACLVITDSATTTFLINIMRLFH